jgi:RNA-directed DNA polymerase
MNTPQETRPPVVPPTATQGGDVLERWLWTEPTVWTERMLTALEQGVKGDAWFSLIDKVWSERNLGASYGKVAANEGAPGVDHVTVEEFGNNLDTNVARLAAALRGGS